MRPTSPLWSRRGFLTGGAALVAGSGLAPLGTLGCSPTAAGTRAVMLIPGYRVDVAAHRGFSVEASPSFRRALPKGYDGRVTLLTRVNEVDGSVRRTLMPINGHAICVHPDGDRAFWNSMNEPNFLSFDPESLELDVLAEPHAKDFIGAGHAEYSFDGQTLLVVERKQYGPVRVAKPEDQYGRITIRDAKSLAVLEVISTHGVSPHEANLLADGKHMAIANYGSTNIPKPGERPYMLEPSLTVIELATGKLVYKKIGPDPRYEVRHVAGHSMNRIATVLVHEGTEEDGRQYLDAATDVYEPDLSAEPGYSYMPAPVQSYDAQQPDQPAVQALPEDPALSRHGQSIIYEPAHDEVIATFPTTHCLGVYAGATGKLKRMVRADRLGLRYPRGIALHPDGVHYVVAGSWQSIFLFRRGEHLPSLDRTLHPVLFDHSHLAVI